jgi:hypothetical protein
MWRTRLSKREFLPPKKQPRKLISPLPRSHVPLPVFARRLSPGRFVPAISEEGREEEADAILLYFFLPILPKYSQKAGPCLPVFCVLICVDLLLIAD